MTATDRLLVAGMHIAFPGVGHVARAGTGYAWVPMAWNPDLASNDAALHQVAGAGAVIPLPRRLL